MKRTIASGLAALGVAATLAVSLPGQAMAAEGSLVVNYWSILSDPDDDVCYEVEIQEGDRLHNFTNRHAYLYLDDECTVHKATLSSGTGGSARNDYASVIFTSG
jgi:hypothetical protein